jgi:hypothetical protein
MFDEMLCSFDLKYLKLRIKVFIIGYHASVLADHSFRSNMAATVSGMGVDDHPMACWLLFVSSLQEKRVNYVDLSVRSAVQLRPLLCVHISAVFTQWAVGQ